MRLLSADVIRRCLVADPGHHIITADFNQIELRIAAAFAGEQTLIDAAKRGEHLIKASAVKLWGEDYTPDQYRYTKNIVYGWLFGGGGATLSQQTGLPLAACYGMIKEYEDAFPALTAYKRREQNIILQSALSPQEYKVYRALRTRQYAFRDDTREGIKAKIALRREMGRLLYGKIGYAVTPFGRRLVVDAAKAYTVVNYKIQATARDIMATALLDIMDDPELEPTVLLPVHDEILGQAPIEEAERLAQRYGEVMSRDFMGVPITAKGSVYGKSWGDGYSGKE